MYKAASLSTNNLPSQSTKLNESRSQFDISGGLKSRVDRDYEQERSRLASPRSSFTPSPLKGSPPTSLPALPKSISFSGLANEKNKGGYVTKRIPERIPESIPHSKNSSSIDPKITYTTKQPRCLGTTKQGKRCLNKSSKDTQYCHHHIDQDERLIHMLNSLSVSTRSISPGYIYVYTIESGHKNVHVYDHEKQAYIRLPISDNISTSTSQTSASSSYSYKKTSTKNGQTTTTTTTSVTKHSTRTGLFTKIFQTRHSSKGQNPRAMLVKVGQTTKTPIKRLAEWKKKCQHPIVLLSPPIESASSKTFDYSKQGWPTTQARPTESAIHNELRALFGKGHVECTGCKENGRHNEWFLVPADKISTLYQTIHYWVQLYKTDQPD